MQRTDYLFSQCGEELRLKRDWYWACRTRSYFIELLHILERIYYVDRKDARTGRYDFIIPAGYEDIGELLMYLDVNYNLNLSLDQLSILSHISRTNLNRRFRKVTGLSVFEYITEYRLYIASSMLRFTNLSIEEISGRVGITYPSNFITMFKKKYGLPPNKFRNCVVDYRKKCHGV